MGFSPVGGVFLPVFPPKSAIYRFFAVKRRLFFGVEKLVIFKILNVYAAILIKIQPRAVENAGNPEKSPPKTGVLPPIRLAFLVDCTKFRPLFDNRDFIPKFGRK